MFACSVAPDGTFTWCVNNSGDFVELSGIGTKQTCVQDTLCAHRVKEPSFPENMKPVKGERVYV